jgi:hypothetical protein
VHTQLRQLLWSLLCAQPELPALGKQPMDALAIGGNGILTDPLAMAGQVHQNGLIRILQQNQYTIQAVDNKSLFADSMRSKTVLRMLAGRFSAHRRKRDAHSPAASSQSAMLWISAQMAFACAPGCADAA